MKKDIHPQYFPTATVRCACGNTFHVGSTKETLETEICSNCHPFYTGKGKFVDAAGRIEKFKEKLEKQKKLKTASQNKKTKTSTSKKKTTKKKILKSTSA